MLGQEPEYRRRIREKETQNQQAAERERDETNQKDNTEQVITALHTIQQQLNRAHNEDKTQRQRNECWERAGVIGLWAAAFVGVGAIIIGNSDSAKQRNVMNNTIAAMNTQAGIMQGQLGEMHQSSVDTAELAETARDTEERQLRAYLGITGEVRLSCYSCNLDTFRAFSPTPRHVMDDKISFNITNGGQTPAYDVYVEDTYYPTEYEGRLPDGFTYPIVRGTEHFVGFSPTIEAGIGYLNAHDSVPGDGPIQQSVVELIIKARRHIITLFYYGNIHYTDVFQKRGLHHSVLHTFPICPATINSQIAKDTILHQKMGKRARTARLLT
jgi:hypothetical protein